MDTPEGGHYGYVRLKKFSGSLSAKHKEGGTTGSNRLCHGMRGRNFHTSQGWQAKGRKAGCSKGRHLPLLVKRGTKAELMYADVFPGGGTWRQNELRPLPRQVGQTKSTPAGQVRPITKRGEPYDGKLSRTKEGRVTNPLTLLFSYKAYKTIGYSILGFERYCYWGILWLGFCKSPYNNQIRFLSPGPSKKKLKIQLWTLDGSQVL